MKSKSDIIIFPCAEKVSMLLNLVTGTFQNPLRTGIQLKLF